MFSLLSEQFSQRIVLRKQADDDDCGSARNQTLTIAALLQVAPTTYRDTHSHCYKTLLDGNTFLDNICVNGNVFFFHVLLTLMG